MIQALSLFSSLELVRTCGGLARAREPGELWTLWEGLRAVLGSQVSVQCRLGLSCLVLARCTAEPLELVWSKLK